MGRRVGIYVAAGLCFIALAVALARAEEPHERQDEPAAGQEPEVELTSDTAQMSYVLGLSGGQQLKEAGLDVSLEAYIRGFRDGFTEAEPALDDAQLASAIQVFNRRRLARQAEQVEARQDLADRNLEEAERFLEQNKEREGVQTAPNGLQYEILREGDGRRPRFNDTVTVHYHGTLPDGTVFDSSRERGQPATFPVDGVIEGWTEALQMMRKGAQWRLYVPPHLAYGERGAGDVIGPNQLLIFEVELLEIE